MKFARFLPSAFSIGIVTGLLSVFTSQAALRGPYAVDSSTLHLWHLDESTTPSTNAVVGATSLTALAGGATLGNASFSGYGTALSTFDGGQNGVAAANKDASLSPLTLVNGTGDNVTMTYAQPTSGAFTMEAMVRIDFDTTTNFNATTNGGNGRTTPMQIFAAEDEANAGRIFQFRIDPIGTVSGNSQILLEFINVNKAVSGTVQNITVAIPTTGPDAILSNSWYHLAVTYDGNAGTTDNMKFYWTLMDSSRTSAAQIGSATMNLDLPTGSSDFAIGNAGRNPSSGNFVGLIDEVRISSVVRLATEMVFIPSDVIISTPPASQIVGVGQATSFSVTASGQPPLSYQWRHGGVPITNATQAIYNIASAQMADAGDYDVIVANNGGSITSVVATLTARTPLNLAWLGIAGGDWDTNAINWLNTGSSTNTAFSPGDNVVFDSRGSSSPTVNLTAQLSPSLVAVNADTDYTLTTSGNAGAIVGTSRLTKNGAGTLILGTDNTYTGATVIDGGTLQVGENGVKGTLGTGPITNNATLAFRRTDTFNVTNGISGSGVVRLNGGTMVLSGNNQWSGGTTITSGTLQVANGSIGSGAIDNRGTLTFATAGNFTVSNSISGSGTLNQNGNGTITFPTANSYSGLTTLNGAGSVRIGNGSALGTGGIKVGAVQTDTGRLELTGNITVNNALGIFPRAFGTLDNPAQFVNVSGTNTLNPPSAITIPGGGNLLTFQSDSGKLILNGGVTAAGVGRILVLKGAGEGEVLGVLGQLALNSQNVYKLDSGKWTLSGANSYSGTTTISNGTLVVNGSLGTNVLTVAGGTLGGTGVIGGSVVVNGGGTLSPGTSVGKLTMGQTLTLQAGSFTVMEIDKAAVTNDSVAGLSSVSYGGTLVISNLNGTLANGDSFKLFDATNYAGAFASIIPATPGASLIWNTNTLVTDGTLRVSSTAANPASFSAVSLSGGNLVLSGSGGAANGTYIVVTSTNVAASLEIWTPVQTNLFDGSGHFSFTNVITLGAPQSFFILKATP